MPKNLILLMSACSVVIIGTSYYSQPLLALISDEFNVTKAEVSKIYLFTQIGYAAGIFFLVPFGDFVDRKKLILIDLIVLFGALIGIYFTNIFQLILIFSFLIGFSSVLPQIFVAIAAALSCEKNRTKSISIVMSGLLFGITFSRAISGLLGNSFGWRTMYLLASILILIATISLALFLPKISPSFKGSYIGLLRSVLNYFNSHKSLRICSLRGAISFACLSTFWSTLVFLVQDKFHLQSQIAAYYAGLLGLVCISGAITANLFGKISYRLNKSKVSYIFISVLFLGWALLGLDTDQIFPLILAAVLFDVGVQGMNILNQSIFFEIDPKASSRINGVYVTSFFIGGVLGTFFASNLLELFHYKGVIGFGFFLSFILLIINLLYAKRPFMK